MAAAKIVSRLSTRLPSLPLKLNSTKPISPTISPLKSPSSPQVCASAKRISQISRLPVELSSLVSGMPLYSAIASARLTSLIAIESQSWGLIPQGISMPL